MRKKFSIVISIFLLIGLISCKASKMDLKKVYIILPDGLPAIATSKFIDDNESKSENKFNIALQKTPDALVAEILKGEAEIAVVPSNLALQAYKKGLDYKVVGTVGWGSMYLISTEEINDVSDLNGKEIYNTGKGLTPDIICREILNSKGIDDKKINYSYVNAASELAPMIINNKAKIAVVPEPALSTILAKKSDTKILLDLNLEWKNLKNVDKGYPQSTILIKESFYKDNKKLCNEILDKIKNSIEWVNSNSNDVSGICEKNSITVNKVTLDKALERGNLKYYSIDESKNEYKIYFESIDKITETQEGKVDYEKIFIEG